MNPLQGIQIMQKMLRLVRRPQDRRHRAIVRLARRALNDDRGGQVLEYSLIAGLIVVAAIGAITCVGTKIVGRWSSLNSSV